MEKLFKITRIIVYNSVDFNKDKEKYYLDINQRNLECLTHVIYVKTKTCPITDYLSLILMVLSFKKNNL